eukprot:762682-Hanusia_phi.AAC.4
MSEKLTNEKLEMIGQLQSRVFDKEVKLQEYVSRAEELHHSIEQLQGAGEIISLIFNSMQEADASNETVEHEIKDMKILLSQLLNMVTEAVQQDDDDGVDDTDDENDGDENDGDDDDDDDDDTFSAEA